MTDTELLNTVKTALNITGTYQDETLNVYIADVKNFMSDSGVSNDLINSTMSVGVIARGVSDLWNYGSATLSDYFIPPVIQLTSTGGE